MTPPDVLGGFSVLRLLVHSKSRGEASVSKRKKVDPEFEPDVIDEDWSDAPHFFGFVSDQIEAKDNYDQRLVGFPLNILFSGMALHPRTGQQSVVQVCYEPAPETFRENSRRKELDYFTTPRNGFFIRVILEKKTGEWQTQKFKGEQLIRSAFGSTLDEAMTHTTIDGPEPDER
jgi:hypothetical protein